MNSATPPPPTTGRRLDQALDWAILAVLVMSPTQYALEIRDGTFVSVVDPLIWMVGAAWGVRTIMAGRFRKINWPPLTAWVFLAIAALSITRSQQRVTALKDLLQLGEYLFLGYMLFSSQVERFTWRRAALGTFIGTGLIILLLTAIQFFTDSEANEMVRGTFGNRHVLGGYLALLLPLSAAVALFATRAGVWRAVVGTATTCGLVLCLSGGAWVGLVPGLLALGFLRGRRAGLIVLCCLVLLCGILLPRLPRHAQDATFESVELFTPEGTVSTRYTEWQAAAIMVLENPLRGVGLGNYQNNIGQYYGTLPNPPGSKTPPDTQNLYLVLASTTGIPGLLAYLALLVAGMTTAVMRLRNRRAGDDRATAAGAFASLLAFSLASIWSPLLVRGIGIPLAFVLALAFTGAEKKAPSP